MSGSFKEEIIKLRLEGKNYREIENEVGCSRATISFHCTNEGLNDIGLGLQKLSNETIVSIRDYCVTHSIDEAIEYFKVSRSTINRYKNKSNKIPLTRDELKANNYINVKNFRQRTKERAVEYKGGKCKICKYDKCVRALEFHHLDPNEKDFHISKNTNKAWNKIVNELDKCILLCSNCHREVHHGITII